MSENSENKAVALAPQTRESLVLDVSEKWGRSADEVNAMISVSFPTLKTLGQLTVAFGIAKKYDLDPMVKEMYAYIDHRGNLTTIVGKDGFMKIARKQEWYVSLHSVAVYPGDEFEMDFAEMKVLKHRMGGEESMKARAGNPIGAYAVLRMKNKPDVVNWVDWSEYAGGSGPWTKQKAAMIRKCAIAVLCREAFGMSWLYDEAEMSDTQVRNGNFEPTIQGLPSGKFKRQETTEAPQTATVEAEAVEIAEDDEARPQSEPEKEPEPAPAKRKVSAVKNLREANDEIAKEIEKTEEFKEVFGTPEPSGPKKDQLSRIANLCAELGYDTSEFVPSTEEGAALVIRNLSAEAKEKAAKASAPAPEPKKPATAEEASDVFGCDEEEEPEDPKARFLETFKDYSPEEIEEAGRDAKARFIEARELAAKNPTERNVRARMEVASECAALAQIKAGLHV